MSSITWKPQDDPHRLAGWSQFARFYIVADMAESTAEHICYRAQVCDAQLNVIGDESGLKTMDAAKRWCIIAYLVLINREQAAIDAALRELPAD